MSQEVPGRIITNDHKDGIIARLIERTEWMVKDADETRRVIRRLDETLDHVSEANGRLSQAVEGLTKAVGDQEGLKKDIAQIRERLAVIEPDVKFWRSVKDRIFWIGLVVGLTAFGAGWTGHKLAEDHPTIEFPAK